MQVTPALLGGEPEAQRERVADLGQSPGSEPWARGKASSRPLHQGAVALPCCLVAKGKLKAELQQGTREGTLEARSGSQLPLSLLSWDSQDYPEFQRGVPATERVLS